MRRWGDGEMGGWGDGGMGKNRYPKLAQLNETSSNSSNNVEL
ncbi:hypothetical protein [Okeania sp. SIO2C9]|nr:hypothetical protein [Okeania sp. SIO2C9]